VFARVVELALFAGRAALRMTPSASASSWRDWRAVGARLINRSTRKLLLTAEAGISRTSAPRPGGPRRAERRLLPELSPAGWWGQCNVPFGLHRLLPVIPDSRQPILK